jgi:hypothetical protein
MSAEGTPAAAAWAKHGPRRIANSRHGFVHALKADDPARAGFEAVIAPRKCADDGALVEHQLDIAADVLGMDQAAVEA